MKFKKREKKREVYSAMVSGLEEDLGSWVEPIKSTKVGLKGTKTSSVTVSVVTPRKCSWVSTSSSSNLGSGMDLDQMDQVFDSTIKFLLLPGFFLFGQKLSFK